MQIYMNFACNFFGIGLSTRSSRLLHKCRDNDTICVLKQQT